MMKTNVGSDEDFCSVAIYLYGRDLLPESASGLMGLSPTRTRIRGEVRETSTGQKITQRIGMWEYREKFDLQMLQEAVGSMIGRVGSVSVIGLVGIEKAEIDIFIPLSDAGKQARFSAGISSALLERLGRAGFDLIFTAG